MPRSARTRIWMLGRSAFPISLRRKDLPVLNFEGLDFGILEAYTDSLNLESIRSEGEFPKIRGILGAL